jgi:hypothetical protein
MRLLAKITLSLFLATSLFMAELTAADSSAIVKALEERFSQEAQSSLSQFSQTNKLKVEVELTLSPDFNSNNGYLTESTQISIIGNLPLEKLASYIGKLLLTVTITEPQASSTVAEVETLLQNRFGTIAPEKVTISVINNTPVAASQQNLAVSDNQASSSSSTFLFCLAGLLMLSSLSFFWSYFRGHLRLKVPHVMIQIKQLAQPLLLVCRTWFRTKTVNDSLPRTIKKMLVETDVKLLCASLAKIGDDSLCKLVIYMTPEHFGVVLSNLHDQNPTQYQRIIKLMPKIVWHWSSSRTDRELYYALHKIHDPELVAAVDFFKKAKESVDTSIRNDLEKALDDSIADMLTGRKPQRPSKKDPTFDAA